MAPDYELNNEIRDRDHAEFEEVCQHEQAEADAAAAYLEKQRQTNSGSQTYGQTYDDIVITRLITEIRLLRQQVRELQDWKDSTHAFLVIPALKEEEEAWKEAMREGMV